MLLGALKIRTGLWGILLCFDYEKKPRNSIQSFLGPCMTLIQGYYEASRCTLVFSCFLLM